MTVSCHSNVLLCKTQLKWKLGPYEKQLLLTNQGRQRSQGSILLLVILQIIEQTQITNDCIGWFWACVNKLMLITMLRLRHSQLSLIAGISHWTNIHILETFIYLTGAGYWSSHNSFLGLVHTGSQCWCVFNQWPATFQSYHQMDKLPCRHTAVVLLKPEI